MNRVGARRGRGWNCVDRFMFSQVDGSGLLKLPGTRPIPGRANFSHVTTDPANL